MLRVGDLLPSREDRQALHADIDTDRGASGDLNPGSLDFACEGHEPPARPLRHRRRQDPPGASREPPGELAGWLLRADHADPRKPDMTAVDDPEAAGRHPKRPAPAPLLELRPAHPAPFALTRTRIEEALQRPGESVETGVVRFLRVRRPPWRHLILGPVPLTAQRRQTPRDWSHQPCRPRRSLGRGRALTDCQRLQHPSSVQAILDEGESPVEREPRRPRMTGERRASLIVRVQLEAECLEALHDPAVAGRTSRLAQPGALTARFLAPQRP